MSTTTEIAPDAIESLARRLPTSGTVNVTVEVLDEEIGDQIQIQQLPWHAFLYDSRTEVLELSVAARGGRTPVVFRHEIHNPTRVWVEEDAGSVISMSIEQSEGPQTIVRFFERAVLESGS